MSTRPLTALAFLLAAGGALADGPPPYRADFEIHRNGKLAGEVTTAYETDGDAWTITSDTRGTRGLAKFLGVEEHSTSHGLWVDGRLRPERFEQTVKVAIKTERTSAVFDWDAGTVRSTHDDGEDVLALGPGTVDPASVALTQRVGLMAGETAWTLDVVDKDEIEAQRFEAKPERIDTVIGCLDAVRVEKIRGPESSRYTRTWYAVDHGYAAVRAEHGKRDGDHMETRITALTVDGEPVNRGAGC